MKLKALNRHGERESEVRAVVMGVAPAAIASIEVDDSE